MCEYCLTYPCPPGCPNYDPPCNGVCAACDEDLPIGSRIVKLGGQKYHYDCIKEMPYDEILSAAGYTDFDEILDLIGADIQDNPDPALEY